MRARTRIHETLCLARSFEMTSSHHRSALTIALVLTMCGAAPMEARAQSAPTLVRMYVGTPTAPVATVTVTPSSASIAPGATVQFAATVTGTTNTTVVWSASGGTISSAGLFIAGQTAGAYVVAATLSGGTIAGSAAVTIASANTGYTEIFPGQDIQARLNASPEGTVFLLKTGVHRLAAPITPRRGNVVAGENLTILSGARLLTNFVQVSSYWAAGGQSQQGTVHGTCAPGYPRCAYPEDLYVDDVMLRHVSSLAEVGSGTWFFDYAADTIYLADDPRGRRVETSVTSHAFGGSAANVTIQGLVIEKFANRAQVGAIHGDTSSGWTVRDNDVRLNHGTGIRVGSTMSVLRNKVHRNGQLGIGGVGDNILVDANEIAYNNTARYETGWEAGGTKFANTYGLIASNNFVHHNTGPGLWTDFDNRNTLYEGNRIEDNFQMGILHEISYSAVIRHNTIRRNGFGFSAWVWGSGIVIAGSPNVEIYGNIVEDNAGGIAAAQQRRGTGAYGPWEISNLWVHDNTVRVAQGYTGLVQDIGDTSYFTSRNNRFDRNTYYLGSAAAPFEWMNGPRTDAQWKTYGNDTSGQFVR
jgi:parallel beta-helix repeat protein